MANLMQSGVASAERVFEVLDARSRSRPAPRHASPTLAGGCAFEDVSFAYREDTRSSSTSTSSSSRARRWRSSARPGRARRRWSTSSCGSMSSNGGGSPSTASTSRADPTRPARPRSAWCSRTPGCSPARSATTSPTAARGDRRRGPRGCRATYVDRFVHSLPDGYDTVLDAEADNLSAGESSSSPSPGPSSSDPSLLILDEATSSVDTRTELLTSSTRCRCACGRSRTSFVIAHRLSTDQGCRPHPRHGVRAQDRRAGFTPRPPTPNCCARCARPARGLAGRHT
jgi:ATP-binding cassette subfamily B multidrug efflux pump